MIISKDTNHVFIMLTQFPSAPNKQTNTRAVRAFYLRCRSSSQNSRRSGIFSGSPVSLMSIKHSTRVNPERPPNPVTPSHATRIHTATLQI